MKSNISEITKLNELPWLPDKLIDFLEEYLKPNLKILEFGCGGSTLWFAKRCESIVSMDHDERWYSFVKQELEKNNIKNVDLRLCKSNNFLECEKFPDNYFDLILVDSKDRIKCIEHCHRILKPSGLLILDNSEREKYKPVFTMLSKWPLKIYEQVGPSKLSFEQPGWQAAVWTKIN